MKFHWSAEVTYDGLPGHFPAPRAGTWVDRSRRVRQAGQLMMRENYCYGHLSFSGLRAAKPLVDDYWDYVAAHDGDLYPHRMAFTQLICVADSDAEADRKYYDAVEYFQRVCDPAPRFDEKGYIVRTRVIPQLRDLWADEPDHWTPEVSRQRVAARAGASALVGGN